MPNPNIYIYPDGITTETQVVVNIYQEYETQDDFYDDIGVPQSDTIENIADKYAVGKEISNTEYENDEPAPVFGQGVFQKQYEEPQLTGNETALEVATAYAGAGLVNLLGANAIIEGAGIIYENGVALVATEQAGAYAMGMALGVSGAACVAASAALAGWELGYEIAEATGAHDYWTELLYEADPWKLKTPGSFMGKILGIQYRDKTYLDSRLYFAIRRYLREHLSNYDNYTSFHIWNSQEEATIDFYNGASAPNYSWDTPTSIGITIESHTDATDSVKYFIARRRELGSVCVTLAARATSGPIPYYYARVLKTNKLTGTSTTITIGRTTADSTGHSYTKNGQTVYWGLLDASSGNLPTDGPVDGIPFFYLPAVNQTGALDFLGELAWNMVYNSAPVELPDGITKWPGTKVDDPSQGAINVVVDVTTKTTVPFYPVGLPNAPFTFPTYNVDTQPNPSVTYNPTTQVVPYAVPWPTQNPESDPDKDPSNPTIIPVPVVIQSPAKDDDEGETPALVAPTIAPPFDLNYQYGGLFNVFNPTAQQLYDFGRFLWVSWTDATLNKIINNPFDGIISLHELYATPNTDTAKNITSGFIASQVSAATVTNRYSSVDCGTIVVPERYQNYLDYEPYTSAYIYLPFIGIVSVNADDIIGHAINITYEVDSYTGACIAIVTHARTNGDGVDYSNEVYQFEGNCAVQLPISGGTQAALTAGLWQVGSQSVGQGLLNIISGGGVSATGIIQGLLDTVGGVSTQLLTKKSDVQHSGTMGSNFGAMAGKKPYIIIKRPRQVSVVNYNRDYGFPAHAMVRIGNCNGYLRVREVNVISATATDEEKKKIEELLKSGVYVN